jgi:alkylated DNA repair dioxygenase AlkB
MEQLFSNGNNLLPFDGEVLYYPGIFPGQESDLIFRQLAEQINWKQEAIKIFGKEVLQPRLTAWYGDPGKAYSYSGITMQPLPWTAVLMLLKQKAESIAGVHFNSALLNLYRNGQDSMGWHSDNEKELGMNAVIASFSFGATRIFKLKHRQDKKQVLSIGLGHGSLLLMRGATQHFWLHSLPKTVADIGPRINITFRVIC